MALPEAILLAVLTLQGVPQWPTLRQELAKHQLTADDFADADQQITSHAVQSDPDWFGIAYYWHMGTDLLPDELRIRTLDRRAGTWRHATLDAGVRRGGSALRLARGAGFVYLDLHINPSAGSLLVLNEDLTVRRRLDGWSSALLPGGLVVYEHNMTHFAPFHAGSVSVYDPTSDQQRLLFPFKPDGDLTRTPLDRSISTIEVLGDRRIRIQVTEQDLRWNTGADVPATVPSGPERRFRVVCVVHMPQPDCAIERDDAPGPNEPQKKQR